MRSDKPFGIGMDDDFIKIKNRIREQFDSMPLTLVTKDNHGFPISDMIRQVRYDLLKKYAPKKLKKNY